MRVRVGARVRVRVRVRVRRHPYLLSSIPKWHVARVECQVPSAKCQVPSAKCQVPRGKWHVASGTWQVARGTWQVPSGTWHVASGGWHATSATWRHSHLLEHPLLPHLAHPADAVEERLRLPVPFALHVGARIVQRHLHHQLGHLLGEQLFDWRERVVDVRLGDVCDERGGEGDTSAELHRHLVGLLDERCHL